MLRKYLWSHRHLFELEELYLRGVGWWLNASATCKIRSPVVIRQVFQSLKLVFVRSEAERLKQIFLAYSLLLLQIWSVNTCY